MCISRLDIFFVCYGQLSGMKRVKVKDSLLLYSVHVCLMISYMDKALVGKEEK